MFLRSSKLLSIAITTVAILVTFINFTSPCLGLTNSLSARAHYYVNNGSAKGIVDEVSFSSLTFKRQSTTELDRIVIITFDSTFDALNRNFKSGNFKPKDIINRGQMARILWRMMHAE